MANTGLRKPSKAAVDPVTLKVYLRVVVRRVLTRRTDKSDELDSSNLQVRQVTLVGPALVGQACPTSGHVGQRVQPDDLLNVSARDVGIGRTGTSNIWSARGVQLAGPTTCRTAPLDLGTIWAVRQVVEPACSMTHQAGRLNHLLDMGHRQVGPTTCWAKSSNHLSDGPVQGLVGQTCPTR
ncbi:hypothetical protein PCANC_01366 [Puccinia coronata f. sp. avenae]|uniref:Uncharacterized protein n=1 Tax=Puccinia coronata f. sp. avenae TaxID=200324 RepID=A0A2N5W654_9BASI|nr:hypothetical protein PCANC_01366 [Puccinia coronata f. sp. avenae]